MAFERVEKVYSRQQMLYGQGATPRLTFEKAQREFASAQADLDVMTRAERAARAQAQSALDQVAAAKQALAAPSQDLNDAEQSLQSGEVRSPVEGIVVGRGGEQGGPVPSTGGLFQIATDLYALEVAVQPKPEALPQIHSGQEALVTIVDLPGAGVRGRVKTIDAGQVVVEFVNTMPAVKPGMQVNVRLKVE
jgi:multidrug resistance efflux pump